jgi:hypothetical protein
LVQLIAIHHLERNVNASEIHAPLPKPRPHLSQQTPHIRFSVHRRAMTAPTNHATIRIVKTTPTDAGMRKAGTILASAEFPRVGRVVGVAPIIRQRRADDALGADHTLKGCCLLITARMMRAAFVDHRLPGDRLRTDRTPRRVMLGITGRMQKSPRMHLITALNR